MTWSVPTPEEQVQFLRNVQRLLAEGLFVASYKFALVRALADLAVPKQRQPAKKLAKRAGKYRRKIDSEIINADEIHGD
jgi:hypothetical protein